MSTRWTDTEDFLDNLKTDIFNKTELKKVLT